MRRSLFPAVVITMWLAGTKCLLGVVLRSPPRVSFYLSLALSLLPVLTLFCLLDAAGSNHRYKV